MYNLEVVDSYDCNYYKSKRWIVFVQLAATPMCSKPACLAPQPGTPEDANPCGGGGRASSITHLPRDEVPAGHPGRAGSERHHPAYTHPSAGHPYSVSPTSSSELA